MPTSEIDVVCVAQRISEQARAFPRAIALSRGQDQLTYEELDRNADRFAGYLRQSGVAGGSTVALCMERSFDWIIAALGILRSGAAYVPLDATWPELRLRFAIEDAGASALVAQTALLNRLNLTSRGVDPCRDREAIAAVPPLETSPIEPDSLAYVIYTSGSTGTPKGVEITHSNLSHLVNWHQNAFSITPQDRASHLAGLGFDAAVWEIWPNLAAGATVCLAEDAVRSSPELIQRWLIRERVSVAFVPTVLAAPMMAMPWPRGTGLRLLLTGGDILHCAPPVGLPFAVVNNYGPTECTVVATSSVLKPEADGVPPIGHPIAGARVYLLNQHGKPVPDGSMGEIYIGGNGVGRGYRNLPDATRRSFLPDPFTASPGAVMYRSGDRGVRRTDGQIEFRGRADRQVKIRGHRIELDEVAHVLAEHGAVEFATVVAHLPAAGESQLVAYVLPKHKMCVPAAEDLQRHLLRNLPEFMVPVLFIPLHSLPLSPNGKIDPAMLPDPERFRLSQPKLEGPMRGSLEEQLLGTVREILRKDETGADDNFFEAGGHSLLGMQLLIGLRRRFGVELTLRQLFEAPTVTRLARLIETRREDQRMAAIWADLLDRNDIEPDSNFFSLGGHPVLTAKLQQRIRDEFGRQASIDELFQSPTMGEQMDLVRGRVKERSALPPGVLALHSHGTRRGIFWIHYVGVNLASVMGDDIPFHFVVLTREDFVSLGESPTFQQMGACLMRKIVKTQSEGPYSLAGFCGGGALAYEIACQLKAAGHEVSLLTMLDTPNPSRFQRWPVRVVSLLGYFLGGAAMSDPRKSLRRFFKGLRRQLGLATPAESVRTELDTARDLVKRGFFVYRPGKYDGEVLHILSLQEPPYSTLHHAKILAGWEGVMAGNLHTEYRACTHGGLMEEPVVASIAHSIASRHCATAGSSSPAPSATSGRMHAGVIGEANPGHVSASRRSGAQSPAALATSPP